MRENACAPASASMHVDARHWPLNFGNCTEGAGKPCAPRATDVLFAAHAAWRLASVITITCTCSILEIGRGNGQVKKGGGRCDEAQQARRVADVPYLWAPHGHWRGNRSVLWRRGRLGVRTQGRGRGAEASPAPNGMEGLLREPAALERTAGTAGQALGYRGRPKRRVQGRAAWLEAWPRRSSRSAAISSHCTISPHSTPSSHSQRDLRLTLGPYWRLGVQSW